jgi:hypothetical protein
VNEHTGAVPDDVRDEIRTIFRGRGQDYMSAEMELERLLRDNPDWREEIVEAVKEIVGDPIYDWQSAMSVLELQGLIDRSWRNHA